MLVRILQPSKRYSAVEKKKKRKYNSTNSSPKLSSRPLPPQEIKPKRIKRNSLSRDFAYDDAAAHNVPIIEEIKLRNSPYLNHLLSLHNPHFYILKCRERLNSGEYEDAYIFTFHSNGLIYTFFENVNPGKATLIFYALVGKDSDGRDYNATIMSIRKYMMSKKINKRQALIYSCYEMIGPFFYNFTRLSHCDFSKWPQLIANTVFISRGNNTNGVKIASAKERDFIRDARYNPFSLVGDFDSFFAGRSVFLSSRIPESMTKNLIRNLHRVNAKIVSDLNSKFNIVIYHTQEDYKNPYATQSKELIALRNKILKSREVIRAVAANRTRLPQ